MKMKTFEASSAQERDNVCNEFEENNKVKATQTSYIVLPEGKIIYVATLFYEEVNKL